MFFQRLYVPLLFVISLSSVAPGEAQPSDGSTSCGKKSGLCWLRIKPGSRGASVEGLQRLLGAKGYKLSPSGAYNFQTAQAVRSFQTTRKLQVDGIVGFQTWEALTPTLRKGDKGASIKVLQGLLWNNNHGTTRDGVFGSATERQVKAFQTNNGYTPTGVADQLVWCRLLGGTSEGSYD